MQGRNDTKAEEPKTKGNEPKGKTSTVGKKRPRMTRRTTAETSAINKIKTKPIPLEVERSVEQVPRVLALQERGLEPPKRPDQARQERPLVSFGDVSKFLGKNI